MLDKKLRHSESLILQKINIMTLILNDLFRQPISLRFFSCINLKISRNEFVFLR